jgi:phage-related protein
MARSKRSQGEKPLFWVGSAKDDLLAFPEAVKSPKGIKTAQSDVDLVSQRLKTAREDYDARYGQRKKQ